MTRQVYGMAPTHINRNKKHAFSHKIVQWSGYKKAVGVRLGARITLVVVRVGVSVGVRKASCIAPLSVRLRQRIEGFTSCTIVAELLNPVVRAFLSIYKEKPRNI